MSTYEESDEYCPHCDNHYVRRSLVHHSSDTSSVYKYRLSKPSHPKLLSAWKVTTREWITGKL